MKKVLSLGPVLWLDEEVYRKSHRRIIELTKQDDLNQSDLNKLSAEAAVEHSSISVDKCYDSEIVCTRCLKKGSLTALRRCTGCKSSSYCSKDCQRLDWPSHKQLCKSIQSQNPQN